MSKDVLLAKVAKLRELLRKLEEQALDQRERIAEAHRYVDEIERLIGKYPHA